MKGGRPPPTSLRRWAEVPGLLSQRSRQVEGKRSGSCPLQRPCVQLRARRARNVHFHPRNRHARLSPGVVAELVSRVLLLARIASRGPAIIPLGRASPRASSGLPGSSGGQPSNAPLRGLAPDGVCRATSVTGRAVGSYSTFSPLPEHRLLDIRAVCFSVALSSRSPSPGVTRHPALWSPDFPPGARRHRAIA